MSQSLAETIFWIAAAACIVAEIAILRSTFAANRVSKTELVTAASRSGELAWAIVPAIALSVVLVATWRRIEAREGRMPAIDHSQMDHSMPMPLQPSGPQS